MENNAKKLAKEQLEMRKCRETREVADVRLIVDNTTKEEYAGVKDSIISIRTKDGFTSEKGTTILLYPEDLEVLEKVLKARFYAQ